MAMLRGDDTLGLLNAWAKAWKARGGTRIHDSVLVEYPRSAPCTITLPPPKPGQEFRFHIKGHDVLPPRTFANITELHDTLLLEAVDKQRKELNTMERRIYAADGASFPVATTAACQTMVDGLTALLTNATKVLAEFKDDERVAVRRKQLVDAENARVTALRAQQDGRTQRQREALANANSSLNQRLANQSTQAKYGLWPSYAEIAKPLASPVELEPFQPGDRVQYKDGNGRLQQGTVARPEHVRFPGSNTSDKVWAYWGNDATATWTARSLASRAPR